MHGLYDLVFQWNLVKLSGHLWHKLLNLDYNSLVGLDESIRCAKVATSFTSRYKCVGPQKSRMFSFQYS